MARMKLLLLALLVVAPQAAAAALATAPACPPPGWTSTSLQALKARSFAIRDPAGLRKLAQGLVACLQDPDPALRDGIAYEALAHWMRTGDLGVAILRTLRARLYAMLDAPDPQGFGRPFAALVLSEIARTDRVRPWMSTDERVAMVGRASAYLESVDDYRGYDDREGWRHGVAHGADWLMQLSLNPALERPQLEAILAAVAAQAVPMAHPYVFGEPERLARPVLFVAQRGALSEADWQRWFAALPPRLGEPSKAYADTAWLARRHDLHAFLADLYLQVDHSEKSGIRMLKPAIGAALEAMP